MPATAFFENEKWKQELRLIEDKNIGFKTRLVNILSTQSQNHQIELMEYFQNRFLKMDEQLSLLRHEVREQLHLLEYLKLSDRQQVKKIKDTQKRLEAKMAILRQDFYKLAAEFNNFP